MFENNNNNNNNALIEKTTTTEASKADIRDFDLGVGVSTTTTTTTNNEENVKFPLIRITTTTIKSLKFPIENSINHKDEHQIVVANNAQLMLKLANKTNTLKTTTNTLNYKNYGYDVDDENFLPKYFRQFPFIYKTYHHREEQQKQQQQQFPLEENYQWQNKILAKEMISNETTTKNYMCKDNLVIQEQQQQQQEQQLKLLFPLKYFTSHYFIHNNNKFPLYENNNNNNSNNNYNSNENTHNLMEFKTQNAIENLDEYLKTIANENTTESTTAIINHEGIIIYHIDFNANNKEFPLKCFNVNLRCHFPICHNTEVCKSKYTNNKNNNNENWNNKRKNQNHNSKLYNKQKSSIIDNGRKNNNNNDNIENINFENNPNNNDVVVILKNFIKKSMKIWEKQIEEIKSEEILLKNFKDDKEDNVNNINKQDYILNNIKTENQVQMLMYKSNNNNNNNNTKLKNNENDKFEIEKKPSTNLEQEKQKQQPNIAEVNKFYAEIDKKNLIMKAKVENIETQAINKILVKEQQQQQHYKKLNNSNEFYENSLSEKYLKEIKDVEKDKDNGKDDEEEEEIMNCLENSKENEHFNQHKQQPKTMMMIKKLMSEKNLKQQQEELGNKGEHLIATSNKSVPITITTRSTTPTIKMKNYENNNRVNSVKPEQCQDVAKEKQSEQLNESTPTTESTMMMMIKPTIEEIIISSCGEESSDVRDQLSQEVRENLRKQYSNKESIDANQLLLINFDNSKETSTTTTTAKTATATNSTIAIITTTTTTNNNKNNNNKLVINEINIDQHVLSSEVHNINNNNNNNNNENNNYQQQKFIQPTIHEFVTTANKYQQEQLEEIQVNKNLFKGIKTAANGDDDDDDDNKDNLELVKEMKFEMRSALANNNNNNNNNSNIIFKQQEATTTLPTAYKYALPATTSTTKPTTSTTPATTTAKYHHATNIPLPLSTKRTGSITTTTTTPRSYLPISNNVDNSMITTTSNDRSMSLDANSILPERTRLRRQRRMLSQGSISEQNEDPVERLNRLRARISGALSQVKGVLKQYSTDIDANSDEKQVDNFNFKNADAFTKHSSPNNNNNTKVEKYEKIDEIPKNYNEFQSENFEQQQQAEIEQLEEEEGPVNFRFVRKVRRRSCFNENEMKNVEKAVEKEVETLQHFNEHNNVGTDSELLGISKIQENSIMEQKKILMEHNEEKQNACETNENETKSAIAVGEQAMLEINKNIVKKPAKKRIVLIKKPKGTIAARRASIAAVESSVKKLLPLHIKAQRRPSDTEAIKILVGHDDENSLTTNQLNAIDSSIICENGSMEEQVNNENEMIKVNNINATPSVYNIKTHENVANTIAMNNDYTYNNNNNNNNKNNTNNDVDNKNNIIICSVNNENENSNKDNSNNNKKNTKIMNDIALMPVNCRTAAVDVTSIAIVKLIDDAENLLGVTAGGDNVNLSKNTQDSTNQINTRQLVEDATRNPTKLDDKQSTAAMVAMLMLSPLQDVVTTGGGGSSSRSKTFEDICTKVDGEFNNNNNNNNNNNSHINENQQIISESIKQEFTVDAEKEAANYNKNQKLQTNLIKQVSELTSEQQQEKKKEEEEKKDTREETALGEKIPIDLKTTTKDNTQLHNHSSSETLSIGATATETLSELASIKEVNMPELQAVPVPVQLSEHNKLKNAEPPFNDVTKDGYGKKRVVLKKFIRNNSIDKSTVLKKLTKIQTSPEPKLEQKEPNKSSIVEVAVDIDNETPAEAATAEAELLLDESPVHEKVQIKPPRKIKKKVIIKRQQRRLSVSDTGFFREPINDDQTEDTASDIDIIEKPISYVTDDEADDDDIDQHKAKNPSEIDDVDGLPSEPSEIVVPLRSCMKAREFQVDDWVMYAERFKKTMVRWKKGRVIERITSISYKLDIDGKEVPAHISYIKKYTDRKVNFSGKEYLEINYENIEQEKNATRSYSIWNMV